MRKPGLLTLTMLTAVSCGVLPMASWSAEIPAWGPIPFEAFDRDSNGLISEPSSTRPAVNAWGRMPPMEDRCGEQQARLHSRISTPTAMAT